LGAESFDKEIGSQTGIVSDSRENSLYSALWVAQALLRKGYNNLISVMNLVLSL